MKYNDAFWEVKMRADKHGRMMAAYKGFKGAQTVSEIQAGIPTELMEALTGKQIGLVMDAISKAYHKGRASHGGLDLCDDAVWFPASMVGGQGSLIGIDRIKAAFPGTEV